MELHQLEYFVAVAEEGGFTRAAERVHISQSGVSAQIRRLEEQLGARLIDRSGRTATLTDAGAAALGPARAVLAAVDAVQEAVDDVKGLLRGRLTVGMVVGCMVVPLFDAIAAFRAGHPGVEVMLREAGSDELTSSLRDGTLDIALLAAADALPCGLESRTITREPVVALAHAHHALGKRSTLRLADLAGQPIVTLPRGTGIRGALDASCTAASVELSVVLEASAIDAVAALAARGAGLAILSSSMAESYPALRSIRLVDASVPAVLGLAWSEPSSPALRVLLEELDRAFGRLG
jgi:DNA-binding transcriptional LysR family regulator